LRCRRQRRHGQVASDRDTRAIVCSALRAALTAYVSLSTRV
jgi:hypothetical protein